MNNLKQKILEAMLKVPMAYNGPDKVLDIDGMADVAAKICLEVAEKAYGTGNNDGFSKARLGDSLFRFEDFKREIL